MDEIEFERIFECYSQMVYKIAFLYLKNEYNKDINGTSISGYVLGNGIAPDLTPEEIKEIKYEYGITLKPIKPKRKTDSWDHVRGSKVSGWKMQSKRKKQWR